MRLLAPCLLFLLLSGCVLFDEPPAAEPVLWARTPSADPVQVRPGERWYPPAASLDPVDVIPLDDEPVQS